MCVLSERGERMVDDVADGGSVQLIVQLQAAATGASLDLRHQIENRIHAALAGGLGEVDGGDIGSGTINVFAWVDAERWTDAFEQVRSVLTGLEVWDRALVARWSPDDETYPAVVWPENHPAEFRYW